MAGLEKQKVFIYDDNGKYLRTIESVSEFGRVYNFSENIFSHKEWLKDNIFEFEDGRIATTKRIGRVGVRKYKEYKNSKYVGQGKKTSQSYYKKSKKGKVVFYDLDGDKIAEFKSVFQAKLISGFGDSTFDLKINQKRKTDCGLIIEILARVDGAF